MIYYFVNAVVYVVLAQIFYSAFLEYKQLSKKIWIYIYCFMGSYLYFCWHSFC